MKEAIGGLFKFGKKFTDTGFNVATGLADEFIGKIKSALIFIVPVQILI